MAAYDSLKSLVQQAIRTNGNNEITGQVLQNVLMAMIDELGGENGYAGVATPSTNPGAPDGKVFYFATEAGTYTHFDGATLSRGIHLLVFSGVTWSHQTLYTIDSEVTSGSNNLITSGAVYNKIINAINALDATVSKSAGADGLSLSLTEVDGKVTNISGSIAPQTYDAYGAASAAQIAAATDATNKVNAAKTQILGDAASDYNTLGKLEDKIQAEASRAAAAESALNTAKADKATTLAGYGINDAYTKTEVNGLVSTPHQNYVTVPTYASLPATGSADTIYRVSNYNGSTNQVDASVYSEYAWNGSGYTFLRVVSQIGEVFDITVYNSNTKYADLAAALGTNGANVPSSIRRGGMSVKFVQSSDNKYVQYRCMARTFSTVVANWQGVDDEPTAGSNNLVKSGGVSNFAVNEGSNAWNRATQIAIERQRYIFIYAYELESGSITNNLEVSGVPSGVIYTNDNNYLRLRRGAFVSINKGDVLNFDGFSKANIKYIYTRENNTNGSQTLTDSDIEPASYDGQRFTFAITPKSGFTINDISDCKVTIIKAHPNDDKFLPATNTPIENALLIGTNPVIDEIYLEKGQINADRSKSTIKEGVSYSVNMNRLRLKEGIIIKLKKGDVISFNNFNKADIHFTYTRNNTTIGGQTLTDSDISPCSFDGQEYVFEIIPKSGYTVNDILDSKVTLIPSKSIYTELLSIKNDYELKKNNTNLHIIKVSSLNNFYSYVTKETPTRIWYELPIILLSNIQISVNNGYNVGVNILDKTREIIYDSNWQTSYDNIANIKRQYTNAAYVRLCFKKSDSSNITVAELNENAINSMSIDVVVASKVENPALYLDIENEILKNVLIPKIGRNRSIVSNSHQGFSLLQTEYYGNSRLSSYKGSVLNGFNFAECDIVWTSDEIPVCCHDDSFTETGTGTVVVIAEHTYAELQQYNYHHEKIASLDEVVHACKLYGLTLQIDHTHTWDTSRWDIIFGIVKKYAMLKRVYFTCGSTLHHDMIASHYSDVNIMASFSNLDDGEIAIINSWKTNKNHVCIAIDYHNKTVADIISLRNKLTVGVEICVYTIDDKSTYLQYMPYVDNISSNKISELMLSIDDFVI
jgi:glycerophosphoryl diester phosphodiesterase